MDAAEADLQGADLRGANLAGASASPTEFESSTEDAEHRRTKILGALRVQVPT